MLADPRTLPLPCVICGVSITIGARPCEHCIEFSQAVTRLELQRENVQETAHQRT